MKTIYDINIEGKNVILRCDYNVPIKDGKIVDDTRIVKSLKTINYILEKANRLVILSHLGRVKTIEDKKNNSLKIVCDYLSKLLNIDIAFCNYTNENEVLNNNKVIMMENTRFFDLDNNRESNSDIELAKYFSSFGEVFINDAFGVSHRKNASNYGITKFLESANGFLMMEEIENLNKLIINPRTPYVVIMGGSKVSDKIKVIDNLIDKVDYLLIGGGMVYSFLKSKGINVGKSIVEENYLDYSKNLLDKYNNKIVLIEDNYTKDKVLKDINNMSNEDVGYDIGPKTIDKFTDIIEKAETIFYNGPMGVYEDGYEYGTKELCNILNKSDKIVVIGGGDTVSAVNKYAPNNTFIISTGGGASLEYLEGKRLPGVVYEEKE